MDLPSVLREVDAWPVQDRMLLVQELWDRLVDQGYEPELWESLRDELDRRLAADEAAPDDVVSREEVKAEALKRAGR
ncbi:MAG: addiction module protein [Planctomycetaceae bacterium]|nr:addiction module protein [Planctomycetaceae bacterium]